uniref:Exonuclease domain-containing protein n=1 Tax=Panagrellus redivivus TaxID=6233 RepID=A0A7E4VM09_PANRE
MDGNDDGDDCLGGVQLRPKDKKFKKMPKIIVIAWKGSPPPENMLLDHEFANLVQYCAIGGGFRKPAWCAIRNFAGVMSTVVFRVNVVDSVLDAFTPDNKDLFSPKYFTFQGLSASITTASRTSFWRSLLHVTTPPKQLIAKLVQTRGDPLEKARAIASDDFDRTKLLLTMVDLAELNYPLPLKGVGVKPSREKYAPVTKHSPIFVIDCEMCRGRDGSSLLTRISVVDESARIIFDTLVKPDEPISDYLTQYSGISPESLKNVKTKLADVHAALRALLPPDAILCGHSLNFDLAAIKFSHPYIIDVAAIYNLTGHPLGVRRISLRRLAQVFLNVDIQSSANGHCSVEDCLATLGLLKLKLKHGLTFGDVSCGFSVADYRRGAFPDAKDDESDASSEDESQEVTGKPVSRALTPRICETCKNKFATQCPIVDCPCENGTPKLCCACLAESTPAKDDVLEDGFDFAEATQAGTAGMLVPLTDYMNTTMSTVFCAINAPDDLVTPTKHCKVRDAQTLAGNGLSDLIREVGPRCAENRLTLIEHDVAEPESSPEAIDEAVKNLVLKHVLRNFLCAVVLASPSRSIAFMKARGD